ncbi:putative RNA polymerase, sigma 28 subunit, FliA/WhiG subfamily (plasmid) [Rippkaea orientalis PCC 8801]|uniref:Putative RNA polymerase, sigma 28 subunit, FliA/WhiG subfamily n=1 Tax=Rippkaea orientalis (strain PCC 8801 / RF-1) TaxID=41431 RepID=B7K6F1_RIPO1|nr:sigma-70 family RNA polymerase sigma factor [Rippkaea orientalis]ACK68373.1 putative RNA polymerase, sigma 28 subunit, FliA/WhiG subfamily [Rippkaea orientalis PCC 8801]
MQKRGSVLEIFSTFLQFESDWISRWIADPKLHRSMQQCLSQSSQSQESNHFWALYWHKVWQTQKSPLASAHLCAYLQEASYWTAKKMTMTFGSSLSLMDLFQIALLKIDKIFQTFNPQQGTNLEQYASLVFRSIIKDELRQRREIDLCTNWALLHKLSQKKLLEALQFQGLNPEAIAEYLLAWKCFQALYAPSQGRSTRKIPEPDATMWGQICQVYNQQSFKKPLEPDILKKRLETCAKAARAYLYPQMLSVDAPKPGQEEGSFLDSLSLDLQHSLESEIIAQEEEEIRKQEREQINGVLLRALIKFDVQSQRLLQMYYGQGLTQQEIAQQLEIKQYTVSRRLASQRKTLILTLGQWAQNTLHYSLDADVLNKINTILEEWLKVHYHHPDLSAREVE